MKRTIFIGCAIVVLLTALVGVAWFVLFAGIYVLPAIANRDHQDFAKNGVHLIKTAAQMDAMFSDCRHYITYGGENSQPVWNSVAFFGDRYELTMQVPVQIDSKTQGEASGSPKFFLVEVTSVRMRSDGTVAGASFGVNLQMDISQWEKVVEADGDFSKIGINLNAVPLPNFRQYAASSRGN